MKTITFLAAAFLLSANTISASGGIFSGENTKTHFNFDEPITFTERGIAFYVFANGEFDFNTADLNDPSIFYKDGRRSNNKTYGAPSNQGVRIEHDAFGRVRRIGNVFVNYDEQSRIKRIGSVYMTYNRRALIQIGNLQIIYNRGGQIISMNGTVKGYTSYNDYASFEHSSENNLNNDDPHVYYRGNGTKVAYKK